MGFPVPGSGGGGGLTNAYAFLTDGVNTANAVGSDTIDFTSPDGSVLFTVVPGSPGVVEATVNIAQKTKLLFDPGGVTVTSAVATSLLFNGAFSVAAPFTVGDAIVLTFAGTFVNVTGSPVNSVLGLSVSGQLLNATSSIASGLGNTRPWRAIYTIIPTVIDVAGTVKVIGEIYYGTGTLGATNILVSTVNGTLTLDTTINLAIDLQCSSTSGGATQSSAFTSLDITRI